MQVAMRPIYVPETLYALIEQRAREQNQTVEDEVMALFEQTLLMEHRAFMQLPLEERRRIMAEQAEKMVAHYEQTADERAAWQGGDIAVPDYSYPLKKWGDLNLAKVSAHYAANSD